MNDKTKTAGLGGLSIGVRLALLPLLFVLVVGAILLNEAVTTLEHKNDFEVMKLTAQMQTLNQRLTKEVLAEVQGAQVDWQQTRASLAEKLAALVDGGTVTLLSTGQKITIQPYHNPDHRSYLQQQQRLLEVLDERIGTYLAAPYGQQRQTALAALLETSRTLDVSVMEALTLITTDTGAEQRRMLTAGIGTGTLAALLVVALSVWISRGIVVPLNDTRSVLEAAARGDMTRRVTIRGRDAIARMGSALNVFLDNLKSQMTDINQTSQTLASASEEMRAISRQMSDNAGQTAQGAQGAREAAGQVGDKVELTATAIEQMSASIREIAKNTAEGSQVAGSAVALASTANDTMVRLGDSSGQIGDVIKVINSIAEQTNLLALNATIEAARAGEAGKGFAVVANEVKELAKATAKATDDIGRMIAGIQTDTGGAVEAIEQISTIIHQMNDIQTSVAGAVEEQTVVTHEISRNVAEAARSGRQIGESITLVVDTAQHTANATRDVEQAAEELSVMAAQLRELVERFRG